MSLSRGLGLTSLILRYLLEEKSSGRRVCLINIITTSNAHHAPPHTTNILCMEERPFVRLLGSGVCGKTTNGKHQESERKAFVRLCSSILLFLYYSHIILPSSAPFTTPSLSILHTLLPRQFYIGRAFSRESIFKQNGSSEMINNKLPRPFKFRNFLFVWCYGMTTAFFSNLKHLK